MNVITYFGADSALGVTMLAQSVANVLAENKHKVLLILASSNPLFDYFDPKMKFTRSIDELRPSLRSGKITKDDVLNICITHKNLTILPPIKDLTLIRYYKENDLERIINSINNCFEYVIIDGGSNIQYPLSISSLLCAKKLYVVISQQEKTLNRFKLLSETVLKPLDLEYEVIVNKYNEDSRTYNIKHIQSITKQEDIITIPYCENGWEAEFNKETLIKYPKYRESIRSSVQDIVSTYKVNKTSTSKLFLESWLNDEYGS